MVAKTIAAWKKLRRQQLADVPALAQTINSRLFYSVNRRLENQILAGDGTGANLLGLLHTTGIADVAYVRLDSDGSFGSPPTTMWGLPLIVSTVMPQGKALVGDFSIGCQLFIREGLNVRMSDSDSDDFLRNRVTVLAEMRAGLATWQPAALR